MCKSGKCITNIIDVGSIIRYLSIWNKVYNIKTVDEDEESEEASDDGDDGLGLAAIYRCDAEECICPEGREAYEDYTS